MSTETFTHDVFVSHSAKDKAVVRSLAERLRNDGLTVWFDEWEIAEALGREPDSASELQPLSFSLQPLLDAQQRLRAGRDPHAAGGEAPARLPDGGCCRATWRMNPRCRGSLATRNGSSCWPCARRCWGAAFARGSRPPRAHSPQPGGRKTITQRFIAGVPGGEGASPVRDERTRSVCGMSSFAPPGLGILWG